MSKQNLDRKNAASPYLVNLRIWAPEANYVASYTVHENGELLTSSALEIPLNFSPAMLRNKLKTIENILARMSKKGIWSKLQDPIGDPQTPGVRTTFDSFMEGVISEGASLFYELAKVPEFADFLSMVNLLPDGTNLRIQTDSALIPWEIIYPEPYNIDLPPSDKPKMEPEKLWGYRFIIGYLLMPKTGRMWHSKTKEHGNAKAFVSMNLNHTIEAGFEKRPYNPIRKHEEYFNQSLGSSMGELMMKGDEIKKVILSDSKATIIYLYCHGKSDDEKNWEEILVDKNYRVQPATLAAKKNKYQSGPIVILNSCSSGAYSPLSFTTFYSEFMEKLALGVLGTTLPMPATFAAAFVLKLIDDYVNYKTTPVTIGNVLWALRQDLIKKRNPLCLFYTLQCPLNATALRPAATS